MSQIGLDWLKGLTNQPDLIQESLDEIIGAWWRHEQDEHWKALNSAIRIPKERVEFCIYWERNILSRIKKGVAFIPIAFIIDSYEADWDGDGYTQTLEILTETLAKHDPEGKLSFQIFTWETYPDIVHYFEQNDPREMFLDVEPEKVQAVWILNGKGLHVLSKDINDLSIIENYTRDLISQQV